ncbi:MAG: hypothetical protein JO250_05640 [Armatimonadetes bacterium]|nr:hypothetical protein [Armatimonadota bacterium]
MALQSEQPDDAGTLPPASSRPGLPDLLRRRLSTLRSRNLQDARLRYLLGAIVLFLAFTVLAVTQSPRPDAHATPKRLSLDWWRYPLEQNAFQRLPGVPNGVDAGFALPHTKEAWIVGDGGMIAHTANAGRTWRPQTSGTTQPLTSVSFTDASHGWAAGDAGTLLSISDGGKNWLAQHSGTKAFLRSVSFTDATHGWAAGRGGTLLSTSDGGNTWRPQASGTTQDLLSVSFTDASHGWAAGLGGTLLSTDDGGKNWHDPDYHLLPAPWYYLSLVPVALMLVPVLRRPRPGPTEVTLGPGLTGTITSSEEETVADLLISDRPLSAADPDPLGFQDVALGLSQFLRNEKTQPPLTIAVTGEWGSGKTSLMNLLCADLASYGFSPVWFNAWHHQQEESLLAALLDNVRSQAVPPWWRRAGLGFRVRLLQTRLARFWPLILVLLLALSFSSGYFYTHPQSMKPATQFLKGLAETWGASEHKGESKKEPGGTEPAGQGKAPEAPKGAPENKPDGKPAAGTSKEDLTSADGLPPTSYLVWIASFLGLLGALVKAMTAFGVNPATLLATKARGARIGDLEEKTSFRYKFAAEFREVTQALQPRTMLILIDDLDRCRPEQVLEILEAVNFLVSSGDCYVVMGMAMERVERCVALGFKDVAEEIQGEDAAASSPPPQEQKAASNGNGAAAPAGNGTTEAGRKARAEFARQYLEKLINIEVPVPTAEAQRYLALMVPEEKQPPKTEEEKERAKSQERAQMLRRAAAAAAPILLTLLLGGLLYGSFQLGDHLFPKPAGVPTNTAPALGKTQPQDKGGKPKPPTPPPASTTPAVVTPGVERHQPWYVYMGCMIAFAVLLAVGLWGLSRELDKDVVIHDSEKFTEAIRFWQPLLFEKTKTPRSLKRFMNRVRYYAMRERIPEPRVTLGAQVLTLLGRRPELQIVEGRPERPEPMPEDVLVGLAAIQHCYPQFWQESNNDCKRFLETQPKTDALIHVLTNSDLSLWPRMDQWRGRFIELSEGIRVH